MKNDSKNAFYIYRDEVWKADDKNLRFFKLSSPQETKGYPTILPDELDLFIEIKPNPETYQKDSPQEKLYRIITDTATVIFLNKESFNDISANVLNYLMEIEEWERMCVVRDIKRFYDYNKKKKWSEIEDFIKKHDKNNSAAKDEGSHT